MCRCRQPQRQASIIKITSTHTTAPRNTTPTPSPSQSTSTSPAPTTPSPTPPPLQPVTFSYMKSYRDTPKTIKHTPHYFYYQDSYSSSSSPPHEAATITAQALVHASCSLPSLHHATNTALSMPEIEGGSPASSLSRSLSMMSTLTPINHVHQKTETVFEHCSCGLTFAVDHILPTPAPIVENVLPEVSNEELLSATDSTYYETINEPALLTKPAHQHHSHHHGHIHYHMNAQQTTHNVQNQTEEIVDPTQATGVVHQPRQHQQHYCSNCQHIAEQSFVQC